MSFVVAAFPFIIVFFCNNFLEILHVSSDGFSLVSGHYSIVFSLHDSIIMCSWVKRRCEFVLLFLFTNDPISYFNFGFFHSVFLVVIFFAFQFLLLDISFSFNVLVEIFLLLWFGLVCFDLTVGQYFTCSDLCRFNKGLSNIEVEISVALVYSSFLPSRLFLRFSELVSLCFLLLHFLGATTVC